MALVSLKPTTTEIVKATLEFVQVTIMNDPSPDYQPSATKRHSKFYSEDSLVVIQVEDTLFRVHKHLLLKSETFSDMFKMPGKASSALEEGISPDRPIIMDGVAASDFEALLTVLYSSYHLVHPRQPVSELENSLIFKAFRLVNMWNFSDLRACLLPLMESALNDVEKVVFARQYDLQDWLVPALVRLCQRFNPLTTGEARKLGLDTVLIISHMREKFRPVRGYSDPGFCYCQGCVGLSQRDGEYSCSACKRKRNGRHYWPVSGRSDVPTGALTSELDGWIANHCVIGEGN